MVNPWARVGLTIRTLSAGVREIRAEPNSIAKFQSFAAAGEEFFTICL